MVIFSDSVILAVIWLEQMETTLSKFALVLLACFCGCTADGESASRTNNDNGSNVVDQANKTQSVATPAEHVTPKIEPGFYRNGADFERVSNVLAKSDANILLDYHSGIEWYDKTLKTRSKLDNINDVKALLASIENKQLVTVSTGIAAWDKYDEYDEYVAKVAEFADDLGFDMTIVTDNNAQGLVISKVIQHEE